MAPVISVEDVSKTFWIPTVRRTTVREHVFGLLRPHRFQRLQVLDSVRFELMSGEALGIMGRNGSGKSTLLKIICGIYPPDRGRVVARASITPILELGVGWNPELDAIDNVFLMGGIMGMSLARIRSGLDGILAFAELERFANLELKHYSSGMAARLAYAVAFSAAREVLILDEIFAVGDAAFRTKCERRFREMHAGAISALIVSHTPGVVSEFCDRALLLDGGRIVAEGPGREVAEAYTALLRDETAPAVEAVRSHR